MLECMSKHGITVKPRPLGLSPEAGKVEWSKEVFNSVLAKPGKAHSTVSPATVAARDSFFSILFHGEKLISAFRLAVRFTASILGSPGRVVCTELLDALVEREATRAIREVLNSRIPGVLRGKLVPPGTHVFVVHDSAIQNDPKRWIEGRVLEAGRHCVKCNRFQK